MKIVVVHGFTSSDNYHYSNRRGAFLGGRREVLDADVVIGVFEPDNRPIVIQAPEGVEVQMLNGHHMRPATLEDGISAADFDAEIQGDSFRDRPR